MTVLLGGRAAEEIVFGAITTGAVRRPQARGGDLALDGPRVRDGHVDHARARSPPRAARSPTARASCATRSSSTSPTRRCARALRLITDAPRASSTQLADALLRNEVLERDDIDRIMDGRPALPPPTAGPARRRRAVAARRAAHGRPAPRAQDALERRCRCPGPMRRRWHAASRAARRRPTTSASCSRPGAIRAVFQPIVRLSRPRADRLRGPRALPHAARPGRAAARRHARRRRPLGPARRPRGRLLGGDRRRRRRRPTGRLLFVNVSPEALGHPGLLELADRLPVAARDRAHRAGRRPEHHALLRERLRPWIARGALVAVDDAGAGFTSLEYVAEIRPDFLKLCRGMVTGVDRDATRQAVLRATVAFAREVGARIVAEGVERPEELAVLRDAEVDYGQGWLFGRPGRAVAGGPARRRARRRTSRSSGGGRLERELACAATRARRLRGRRRAPRPPRADAERLPRAGRPPALPGRRAATGRSTTACRRPPASIGRTFRTGERRRSSTTSATRRDYLPRRPVGRRAEVCLPLRVGGRVVGVLNAESPTRARRRRASRRSSAAPRCWRAARRSSAALGRASPAQRLARTVARLAALEDPEDIVRETARRRARARRLRVRDGRARRRPRRPLRRTTPRARSRSSSPTSTRRRARPRSPLGRPRHVVLHGRRHRRARLRRPRAAAPRRRRRR